MENNVWDGQKLVALDHIRELGDWQHSNEMSSDVCGKLKPDELYFLVFGEEFIPLGQCDRAMHGVVV